MTIILRHLYVILKISFAFKFSVQSVSKFANNANIMLITSHFPLCQHKRVTANNMQLPESLEQRWRKAVKSDMAYWYTRKYFHSKKLTSYVVLSKSGGAVAPQPPPFPPPMVWNNLGIWQLINYIIMCMWAKTT